MMLEVLVLCNFRYEVDDVHQIYHYHSVLVLCNFRYEVDATGLIIMIINVLVLCNFRYEVDFSLGLNIKSDSFSTL